MRNLKLLVTVGKGLGDCIEGTPLCHALHLLGHKVDLFLDSKRAEDFKALFSSWPVLGKVFTEICQIEFSDYDLGISCKGRNRIYKRFPAGLFAEVRFHDIRVHQLADRDANFRIAQFLGYEGPVPPGHVEQSARAFGLCPNTVVVHAGCNKTFMNKRWGHWPDICQLLTNTGYPVVIVGADQDRSDENWEVRYRTEFNLPLTDLASLMSQASFYLGNDSGVGHMAAALGLPGLILFGPTDPRYYSPNSKVLKPLSFAKALRFYDPTQSPKLILNVDGVWRAIEQLLANPAKDPPRPLPPIEIKYPAAPSSPPCLDDPPETRIYKNASHSLFSVFSDSARKLMDGQDRKAVAAKATREAGRIRIEASFQLLKLRASRKTSLSKSARSMGQFHARRGMRAGYILRAWLLYQAHKAISLLRPQASVPDYQ